MRIKVPQLGQVGLMLDRDDIELPPNAWTDGRNVRFQHGSVRSAGGWSVPLHTKNLLTYSEDFDNAAWLKTRATITANAAIAPDGTLTADKLVSDVGINSHFISQGVTSTNGTLSVFAEAAEFTHLKLATNAHSFAASYFDLSSGVVASENANHTASIESVGGGIYRCSIKPVDSFTSIYIENAGNGVTSQHEGDGTSGIYLWGAQLEIGSEATYYTKTEAALVTKEIIAGEYLRGTAGDFLVLAVDSDSDGTADDVVSWDGTTETDLSWSSIGTAADLVTMTQLHGHVIINNGTDSPSFWDGEAASVSPLIYDGATTWATETYSAKVIRSFRNFLIAMDVTDAVGRNPRLLHWSSPAVPGNLPASWDFSDITEESGRQELAETTGIILDGAPLRDMFVVYKEDAIYLVNYIAGQFVFSFYPVSSDRGIYATNCVAQVGSKHFVMGQRDVYLFDGSSEPVSVIEGKAREYLFNAIDPDAYRITHLVHNRADNEVWICYPTVGETRCNEAMVFNHVEGTWSRRDLPGVNSTILGGNLDSPASDWDDETALDWDSETEATWTSSNYTTGIDVLYGLGVALYKMDDTNQQDAVDQVCFVERTEFSIGELDDWYMVRAVFPRATGGAFTVEIGYQATQDSEVTWSDPQTWTPGTSRRLDFRVTGRMLALRVKSTGNTSWELFSIDVDAVPVGTR